MTPATKKARALAVFTTLFAVLSIPQHVAAQSCGEVGAPACDGACPPEQACVASGGSCACVSTDIPCGFLQGGPACYGYCPDAFPVCIVGVDLECLCIPAFTPTPTHTETPTLTPTISATPTRTPTSTMGSVTPIASPCVGDCDRDKQVTVDELVRAVNIALGNSFVSTCRAVDANADDQVTVEEIVRAVTAALSGCD